MKTKDFYDYENLETFNPDRQESLWSFYEIPIPKEGNNIEFTIDLSLSHFLKVDFTGKHSVTIYFANAKPGHLYWIYVIPGWFIHWKHGNNIYLRESTLWGVWYFAPNHYPRRHIGIICLYCTPKDENSVYLDLIVNTGYTE